MVTRKEFREKEAKRKSVLESKRKSWIKSLESGILPEGFVFEQHSISRETYARGETIYILGYPIRKK